MKILLAIDGSPCSEAAVREVAARPWMEGSEVKILSVVTAPFPDVPLDPFFVTYAAHREMMESVRTLLSASDMRESPVRMSTKEANEALLIDSGLAHVAPPYVPL